MNARLVVVSAFSALTLLHALGASAHAAAIGQATSVVPATTYARGAATQNLGINEQLEQNDRVKTLADGSTQFQYFYEDTLSPVKAPGQATTRVLSKLDTGVKTAPASSDSLLEDHFFD